MRVRVTALLIALALISACAAREELLVKNAAAPAGVNLSGSWQLRSDDRDTVQQIDDAELRAAGGKRPIVAPSKKVSSNSSSASSGGTLVHVFLETGDLLKVTQTSSGLFISFDRSVVEEYRFGEKNNVSVGPVVADRVSGWESNAYVIETLDKDGAKLVERYQLGDDGATMTRAIRITHRNATRLDLQQVFDREL